MAKMGKNLIGNRYGKLVVIGVDNVNPGFLVCRCDCGNIKSIRKCNLLKKSGATQSCGCLRKEHGRELGRRMSENLAATRMLSAKYNTNFPSIESKTLWKNNKTGVRGVWFDTSRGCYEAYIGLHRKKILLGRFKNFNDAVEARQNAEEDLFAPLIAAKYADLQEKR